MESNMEHKVTLCPESGKHMLEFERDWGYVQAVRHRDLVFISGCVSIDPHGKPLGTGEMRTQVFNAYKLLEDTLKKSGLTMSHILQEKITTTNMALFLKEGLEIRKHAYQGSSLPGSSAWTEVVALAQKEFLFEVEAIAGVPST
jgi:enamine deaminase RidA (YjgF/YER057c/UK114 family)